MTQEEKELAAQRLVALTWATYGEELRKNNASPEEVLQKCREKYGLR